MRGHVTEQFGLDAQLPGHGDHRAQRERQAGLVTRLDGQVAAVLAFDIHGGRIRAMFAVRNPEKLGAWR